MISAFLTCLYILGICAALTFGSKCGQSEYSSAAGECCPMCAIGFVVREDCRSDSSTICTSCSKGTFMNKTNGNFSCFQCKTCENGLHISQDCTPVNDTVCGVLDGYYCMQYSDDKRDCLYAIKHSKCKPGEQIKNPGTKISDTVCEPCPSGFDSPEGVNCSKWTDTPIKDVQSKPRRNRYGLIAAVLMYIVLLLSLFIFSCLNHQTKIQRLQNIKQSCIGNKSSHFTVCPINQSTIRAASIISS
ncbi:hypothetical protein KOW79_004454 [Hemibagrus wyckioides]|uniref:TNFR-Cys domain-containing protein n=1 Tax=Hemibagrus wyckioides TaxID=337641 RepID=A0A9D3P0V9_9TELE|nr:hypothetical protein KOW79_004454 [Hemibagrus wyckioides]